MRRSRSARQAVLPHGLLLDRALPVCRARAVLRALHRPELPRALQVRQARRASARRPPDDARRCPGARALRRRRDEHRRRARSASSPRSTRDGLRENTIVVVTADHGETLYDHGHGVGPRRPPVRRRGHARPARGRRPARTGDLAHASARIVRDVDLAPTLYELHGRSRRPPISTALARAALDGQPHAERARVRRDGALVHRGRSPRLPDELRLPYPGIAELTEVDTTHSDEIVLAEGDAAADDRRQAPHGARRALEAPLHPHAHGRALGALRHRRRSRRDARRRGGAPGGGRSSPQGELWSWMLEDAHMVERGGYLVHARRSGRPRRCGERARRTAHSDPVKRWRGKLRSSRLPRRESPRWWRRPPGRRGVGASGAVAARAAVIERRGRAPPMPRQARGCRARLVDAVSDARVDMPNLARDAARSRGHWRKMPLAFHDLSAEAEKVTTSIALRKSESEIAWSVPIGGGEHWTPDARIWNMSEGSFDQREAIFAPTPATLAFELTLRPHARLGSRPASPTRRARRDCVRRSRSSTPRGRAAGVTSAHRRDGIHALGRRGRRLEAAGPGRASSSAETSTDGRAATRRPTGRT